MAEAIISQSVFFAEKLIERLYIDAAKNAVNSPDSFEKEDKRM
jgi:hypothetical protein